MSKLTILLLLITLFTAVAEPSPYCNNRCSPFPQCKFYKYDDIVEILLYNSFDFYGNCMIVRLYMEIDIKIEAYWA